jgi:hypothetical protein
MSGFIFFPHSTFHVDHHKLGITIFGATKLNLCILQTQHNLYFSEKNKTGKASQALSPTGLSAVA